MDELKNIEDLEVAINRRNESLMNLGKSFVDYVGDRSTFASKKMAYLDGHIEALKGEVAVMKSNLLMNALVNGNTNTISEELLKAIEKMGYMKGYMAALKDESEELSKSIELIKKVI